MKTTLSLLILICASGILSPALAADITVSAQDIWQTGLSAPAEWSLPPYVDPSTVTDITITSDDLIWSQNSIARMDLEPSSQWSLPLYIDPATVTDIIVAPGHAIWSDNNLWKKDLAAPDSWNLPGSASPGADIIISSDDLLWANNIWRSDLISLLEPNSPPVISDIPDQNTIENLATPEINFTVQDAETDPTALSVTTASSNPTLVPKANILLGGSGTGRTLAITPAAGQTGSATITVTVSDGDKSASDTFVLTVTPNDLTPPQDLEARSGAASIQLTWSPTSSTYYSGYNIYRSASGSTDFTVINSTPVADIFYADNSALEEGTPYTYYLKTVDAAGEESGPSETASDVFGQIRLFIPDARGAVQSQVTLPVNIANADDLDVCGVDIYVTYDPAVLSAVDIQRTPLSEGFAWAPNLQTPGIVRAVIASSVPKTITGDGALFYVLFDVAGTAGESTGMQFQTADTFLHICGEDNNPVAVTLDLNDAGIFTVDGAYNLGDVNGDGRINSADVIIAMSIAVGKTTPTPAQIAAGDVSGDNRVRTNDAALILRLAAGLPISPGTGARSSERAAPVTVRAPENIFVAPGGYSWVPVEISDLSGVAGAEVILNYDSGLFSATDVRTGTSASNYDFVFNNETPGQIRISLNAMDSSAIPAGQNILLSVRFDGRQNASGTSPLTLAGVRLNDTYGRDFATSSLQTPVSAVEGMLTLRQTEIGDLDHIGGVNLGDAILALRIVAGLNHEVVYMDSALNPNGKIGLPEAIFILRTLAGAAR